MRTENFITGDFYITVSAKWKGGRKQKPNSRETGRREIEDHE